MSAEYGNMPCGLGEYENCVNADSNPVLRHWLGRRATFKDLDYSISGLVSGRSQLSGYDIEAIFLRNNSGVTLYPGYLAQVARTGREAVKEVIGYNNRADTHGCVLVDQWLPSTGVPNGYGFWGIIKGVVTAKTPMVDTDFNGDVAAFAPLVCVTAQFTTATTAGRLANITLAGQTAATASLNYMAGIVGRALSTKTTANTNTSLLVALNIPWIN